MTEDRAALKQRIKEANDIVDVVGKQVALRQAGAIFKGLCPFHDDHNPSFQVDPRRQTYRCWSCGKYGDVFSFVQEINRVGFVEAMEELARNAGISLENQIFSKHGPSRARMLDVTRWAAEQFHQCLLDAPVAEPARLYLGERRLIGDIVRRFGLGYAPPQGDWLVQKANAAGQPLDLMEQLGLISKNNDGNGFYGRFRDRVMFPIRDIRGQTVGFGGRILPSSLSSAKVAKYINSAENFLFSKSDQLYGIDQARPEALKAKELAVVEGYTDVLMAHQMGISNVVATMGTALNDRHVRKLRHVVSKVVLVFDADAGGNTGVDRALEVFVRNNLELRVAKLPAGLDPCDLLVEQGVDPFREAIDGAIDVFEHKLAQVWQQAQGGVEAQERAVQQMLGVLALTPELRSVKMELMVNRIAHRLGSKFKEETLWKKLRQLHGSRQQSGAEAIRSEEIESFEALATAAACELELLQILFAEPLLVAKVKDQIDPRVMEHSGVRFFIEGLYRLLAEGIMPDLDELRGRIDNEALLAEALDLRQRGLDLADRSACLEKVLERFRERDRIRETKELQNQLQLQKGNHLAAREMLRQLRH